MNRTKGRVLISKNPKENLDVANITKTVKQSIALLKASFGDNPKKLADWGINVDDSPKTTKSSKTP